VKGLFGSCRSETWESHMPIRYLSLLVLALPLAVLGYFFFGIVGHIRGPVAAR
jgi:hypothetical protein